MNMFNELTQTITTCLLFITLTICIVIAFKSPSLRKLFLYVIAVIIIAIGGCSGVGLYRDITAESYVIGSLELNKSDCTFEYVSTSISFYPDEDIYSSTINLDRVSDFNGKDKIYNVYLNDYTLVNTTFSAGSIYSLQQIDFHNLDDEVECSAELKITILFYNSKTELKISTTNTTAVSYLENYFSNNGFRLYVVENGV